MRKTSSANYENEQSIVSDCPITSTFRAVGGRWKLVIIWHLRRGALRYGMLKKAIPRVSEKMLTQQLKALTRDGWIARNDFGELPPRTEYQLTQRGKSFIPILEQVYDWGIEHGIAINADDGID